MRRSRWPHVLLGLWALAVIFAITWPGYEIFGNHIDPMIFGLPFSLFWIMAWSLCTFGVLTAYFLFTERDA